MSFSQSSSDPSKPAINPNFMQLPWDTMVQARLFSILRSILSSPLITSATNTSVATLLYLSMPRSLKPLLYFKQSWRLCGMQ
jgi:hypothetical protein